MTKWIENLDIILNKKGFGLNRDFEKEMEEHIENWSKYLNSNSSELVAKSEKTYEGIIVTVKKRKGEINTLIPFKVIMKISNDSVLIKRVTGKDWKSMLSSDSKRDEDLLEWTDDVIKNCEDFLNEESEVFIHNFLNLYLEKYLEN
jgi:hypothetical protein